MTKLLIIGIDGMDRELVAKYMNDLPNFKKYFAENPDLTMSSVFPPDSDTAWASIYTGLNPAKHGVVDFVDPLERKKLNQKESEYVDADAVKGKTFWDILGKKGIKSNVIYPHICFPVWDINGFMINPHPETEEFQYSPSNFDFDFPLSDLEVQKRIPRTKLEFKEYLIKKHKIVENEFNFAKKMLRYHESDILFFYSSALDSIMHIFWNYCDENDPTYPGNNPYKNAIKDFHIQYDKLVGELLDNVDDETTVMILSDHGHAMRPVKLFNINEVLRNEGLLVPKSGAMAPVHNTFEQIKRFAVNIAQKSGLRPLAQTILRMFPSIKKAYTNPSSIDFEKTKAHCIDLSGMKSYTYGGIRLHKEKFFSTEEYVNAKKKIISVLKECTIPETDKKVVAWICEKEDFYQGPFLDKYPDIIFNLVDGYGAGWAINLPVFSNATAHKFYPGSHRGATPIFYLINSKKEIIKKNIELMDIAPTVLDIFGENAEKYNLDGKSIFA